MQRGRKGDARNAFITYDWNLLAPWLSGQRPAPPPAKSIQVLDLGDVGGLPLGLTDGAALSGGAWVFSAMAAQDAGSVPEGPCAGSVIGVVDADGRLRQLHGLQGAPKVQGVAVRETGNELTLTLVTDSGDPARASQVLQVDMALALALALAAPPGGMGAGLAGSDGSGSSGGRQASS